MLHQQVSINKNKGYVAMMSVLIVSAVGLIISVSLLVLGINYERSNYILEQSYNANWTTKACSNIALNNIRLDALYTGDEIINLGFNNCYISLIIKDESTYTINTQSRVGSVFSKNKIVVVRSEEEDTHIIYLGIISWQDLVDL